jgi:hypothetical protein
MMKAKCELLHLHFSYKHPRNCMPYGHVCALFFLMVAAFLLQYKLCSMSMAVCSVFVFVTCFCSCDLKLHQAQFGVPC